MKKIAKILICLISILIASNSVLAKELDYYINDKGVAFSKSEYDFLTKMYWNGCQDLFTKENYEDFVNSNIINGKFDSVEFSDLDYTGIMPLSTSHETGSKTIKISKTCNTNCVISVTVTWKGIPNTKSYDVVGARFSSVKLKSTPTTTVVTSDMNTASSDVNKFSNGFGVSIALPKNGSNYIVSQTYTVSKGGTVYASYQHAKKNISLADSKKYSISKTGYGGVFKFTGTAANVYDQMGGVSISV